MIETKLESEIMQAIDELSPKVCDEIRGLNMSSGIEVRSMDVDNIYKLVSSLDQLASTLRRVQIYRSNLTGENSSPMSFSD